MKKITAIILIVLSMTDNKVFAQLSGDGSYLWNSTTLTYSINEKTEIILGNKDHYSNQIDQLDYFYFDIAGYRKFTNHFSLGLSYRRSSSYKSEKWNPSNNYLSYFVYLAQPGNIKIKCATRFAYKTFETAASQYGIDNISTIDLFVKSNWHFPKPYVMDEVFTEIKTKRFQNIRLYGGLHILKLKHIGFDFYYCYWKTHSGPTWSTFNVLGINTKVRI
jgi:hypothetical protein